MDLTPEHILMMMMIKAFMKVAHFGDDDDFTWESNGRQQVEEDPKVLHTLVLFSHNLFPDQLGSEAMR